MLGVLVRVLVACAPCAVMTACDEPLAAAPRDTDPLSHLPKHDEQLDALCARGHADAVSAAFCADRRAPVRSLGDVLALLDLTLAARQADERPAFSLIAQSSALPSRSVSALNPGAVIVSLPVDPRPLNGNPGRRRTDGNVVSLAYARGDQVVEILVKPPTGALRFYLLRYEQDCGTRCTPTDLFSEQTENDWTGWSLYDDGDLENSLFDCLHCHQPEGPGTPRITRMQELENPWTHWEAAFTLSGRVLLDDTLLAHGGANTVAGIPTAIAHLSDPVAVEDLVRFTDSAQPNVFPAPQVEAEVMASSPAQPRDNSTPGTSVSWQVVYDAAVRGEAIPPPHHDAKVTDPERLPELTAQIQAFIAGDAPLLPDLRDAFDARALAGMSHRPAPNLDGEQILVHACAQCHNGKLNPELSRARFNVFDRGGLTDPLREAAVARLYLEPDDRYRMPPHLFRDLSDKEKAAAADALRAR